MKAIADICVIPIGAEVSLSPYIAACERILRDANLNAELHAYGTTVEGDWDAVMAAIKKCHEAVHEMGVPRISTTIKIGTRMDRAQTKQDKVDSVEQKLRG